MAHIRLILSIAQNFSTFLVDSFISTRQSVYLSQRCPVIPLLSVRWECWSLQFPNVWYPRLQSQKIRNWVGVISVAVVLVCIDILFYTIATEKSFTKNTRDPNLLNRTWPILHDAWWFLRLASCVWVSPESRLVQLYYYYSIRFCVGCNLLIKSMTVS